MPTYEFTCKECQQGFTVRRKVSEMNDPAACPACGSEKTDRQMSIFYATNTGGTTAAASSPKTNIRHI